MSGVVDLVSKATEGLESTVDGGICRSNENQMRLPRAFYTESGAFREFSYLNAKLYAALR